MSDNCKAMERPTTPPEAKFRVTESCRAVLRCKYLGPTDSRGTRIKVSQFESAGLRAVYGSDTNAVTVSWDDSLGVRENYANAVTVYLERAGWNGEWTVATCDGGAVAVYVPGTAGGAL